MDLLLTLKSQEAKWLERPFKEEEIWKVINSMASDKALGPYGFYVAFFQTCWDVIKTEVTGEFHEF